MGRLAEGLVQLRPFGELEVVVRRREEDDVGKHQEHPPEAVDRVEQSQRKQSAGEVEARNKVPTHPYDQRVLARLAIFFGVSVIVDDEDIHAGEPDGRG